MSLAQWKKARINYYYYYYFIYKKCSKELLTCFSGFRILLLSVTSVGAAAAAVVQVVDAFLSRFGEIGGVTGDVLRSTTFMTVLRFCVGDVGVTAGDFASFKLISVDGMCMVAYRLFVNANASKSFKIAFAQSFVCAFVEKSGVRGNVFGRISIVVFRTNDSTFVVLSTGFRFNIVVIELS